MGRRLCVGAGTPSIARCSVNSNIRAHNVYFGIAGQLTRSAGLCGEPAGLEPHFPAAFARRRPAAAARALPLERRGRGALLVSAMGFGSEVTPERIPGICLALAAQALAAVGLLSIAGPIRRQDFGIDRPHLKQDICTGAFWFLASWGPVLAVNLAVSTLGLRGDEDKHAYLKLLDKDAAWSTVFWIALSVLVAAPLVEELIYRVILQGWLETRMPVPAAVVLVALIFSAVHQVPDCLPMFPLALILGLVYHRRHSYAAVVVLHALFNGTNLTLALLMRK
jgi:membrane protease YdiL (CAAX protease family)